ncbi:hypothetical protein FPK15_contig00021-0011 [Flavobacterium psychrophilum]|nr:hypothetical protein FPK15_contig00021-0011 [Flavobacterium psychrophilum]
MSKQKVKIKFNFFDKTLAENKKDCKFALAIRNYCKVTGPWCNGNTTVFGAVVQGSSPCGPTKNPSFLKGFFYAN